MIVCLQPLFGSSDNKTKQKIKDCIRVRTFDPLVNDDDVCRNYLAVRQNTVGKKYFCLSKVHFYTLVLCPLNELVLITKTKRLCSSTLLTLWLMMMMFAGTI